MSKIKDEDLVAGLRQRKKSSDIVDSLQNGIVTQMQADAQRIPLVSIQPSPFQIRQINEQTIEDMMESIRNTGGLISPVVVRPHQDKYELIAGHTRFAAYQKLGYLDIPAVIRAMNDAEASRALAADNLSRKDLSDYEIFKTIHNLMEAGHIKSNSEASRLLGRSRQDIIRYMAFAKFPADLLDMLEKTPSLLGADAAKKLLEFLPDHQAMVIDACHKLKNNQIKTQTAMLVWIRQQIRDKPTQSEHIIFNQEGVAVGKLQRNENGIRLISKNVDLMQLEKVMKDTISQLGFTL